MSIWKENPMVVIIVAAMLLGTVCFAFDCWRDSKCAEAGLVQKKVDAQVIWVKSDKEKP